MIESPAAQAELAARLPFLQQADESFRSEFYRAASLVNLPAGYTIAEDGSDCGQLAIVLDGQVRVFKLSENGREMTLYRIEPGDSCVLTASCIIGERTFPAIAVTETATAGLLIPAGLVKQWIGHHPDWSAFVFGLISQRLAEVITKLEDLAFHHVDERVAAWLKARSDQATSITVTHQQIAAELGTTREVISRILKDFEARGLVRGHRGHLEILDPAGL
ncbi:MAG: Crp/Fnr family transcriptional regulator [Pseudomonadales bacterium]|nr:Crp/Fnr family transcriptional regulator [Pseudomonadales bacterium]